jgi:hypothetical protein
MTSWELLKNMWSTLTNEHVPISTSYEVNLSPAWFAQLLSFCLQTERPKQSSRLNPTANTNRLYPQLRWCSQASQYRSRSFWIHQTILEAKRSGFLTETVSKGEFRLYHLAIYRSDCSLNWALLTCFCTYFSVFPESCYRMQKTILNLPVNRRCYLVCE